MVGIPELPQEYPAAHRPHAGERQDIWGKGDLLDEFLDLTLQEFTPSVGSLEFLKVHREPRAVCLPDCCEPHALGCGLGNLIRFLPGLALSPDGFREQRGEPQGCLHGAHPRGRDRSKGGPNDPLTAWTRRDR